MVRNQSVTRIIMWLCFGTAFLSLLVHWRTTASTEQFDQLASTKTSQQNNLTALGTEAPSGKQTQKSKKLHNTKPRAVSKNVAMTTEESQQTRLVSSEQKPKPKPSFLPQSLLPQAFAQPKFLNHNRQKSDQTQVVVDLSDRRAYVYRSDIVIASYPIAIGKKGWETPTGTFQIMHKQYDPIWQHPITDKVFPAGPDSPLGDRWIGFWSDGHNKIGFHGTPDNNTMGTAISHGCIRMRNPDVRLLYKQVSLGTPVIVRD
jgi:lipoprotein-anchoring transpeptidase ErfK/SrfK